MSTRVVLLLATLAVALTQPRVQAAESGIIRGTVLRLGSPEPVPGAAITLARRATPEQSEAFFNPSAGKGPSRPSRSEQLWLAHDGVTVLQAEPGGNPGDPLSKPTFTDSAGRFAIENVPAGSYAVSARREGYFGRGSDPETPAIFDGAAMNDMVLVTVVRGESASVALELIPAAAISGRITGPQGAALVGQDVRAFRAHRQGDETLLRGVTVAITDDRGEYRLHTLPPGEYFIASGLGLPEYGDPEPIAASDRVVPVPGTKVRVLTFHPSTISPETASPIVVKGGEDLANKDINVVQALVIRISGQVINDSGIRDASSASIELVPGKETWILDHGGVLGGLRVLAGASATFTESNRGSFEIRGAFRPGAYEIRAAIQTFGRRAQDQRKAVGSTPVDIASQDVDGVVVVVTAPAN